MTIQAIRGAVEQAIQRASDATGVDFSFLLGTAKRESGYNPRARAASSSAAGLFQFVDQTWLSTLKRHGSKYGYARYADLIQKGADGRYHVAPPRDPMRAEEARALADAQERHALEHGGRATLARELVDLIVHSPALDAGLSRALGITYRPLSETLDAWDAWALRMGLLSPRTSGEAHG